jgi:hypothetical protein
MAWRVWFALADLWLVAVLASVVVLQVEYGTRGCEIPSSLPHDSAPARGVAQRVWVPPGTSCVQAVSTWYPAGTPDEWDRPESWRNGVAAVLALSGVGLVWALRREQRTSDEA